MLQKDVSEEVFRVGSKVKNKKQEIVKSTQS